MKIKAIAVDKLKPDPNNPREHSERSIAAIAASLKQFGQQKPLVITADNTVLAGNGTLSAAKTLGWPTVMCQITDLSPEAAKAYRVADNRIGELSNWNQNALAVELKAMESFEASLIEAVGYTTIEASRIIARAGVATIADASVTQEDVDAAAELLANSIVQEAAADKIFVICPKCGEEFHIWWR